MWVVFHHDDHMTPRGEHEMPRILRVTMCHQYPLGNSPFVFSSDGCPPKLASHLFRAHSMESLLLRTGLSSSRPSFSCCKGIRKLQEGHRIGADRVPVVRARRNGGGEGVPEPGKRRPLWQRAWGFGGRSLGFGETWEVDPRGQRELEEFDLFLEGRGLDFQWKDVLEPSVENVLALVLTGLFLYAVVLIGWQLLLVAASITLSALKYAVIAAIVVGVLIFFI